MTEKLDCAKPREALDSKLFQLATLDPSHVGGKSRCTWFVGSPVALEAQDCENRKTRLMRLVALLVLLS